METLRLHQLNHTSKCRRAPTPTHRKRDNPTTRRDPTTDLHSAAVRPWAFGGLIICTLILTALYSDPLLAAAKLESSRLENGSLRHSVARPALQHLGLTPSNAYSTTRYFWRTQLLAERLPRRCFCGTGLPFWTVLRLCWAR